MKGKIDAKKKYSDANMKMTKFVLDAVLNLKFISLINKFIKRKYF